MASARAMCPRSPAGRLVLPAFAVTHALACGELLGVGDYRLRGDPPDALGEQSAPDLRLSAERFGSTAACEDCLATQCEAEVLACARDPACNAWGACAGGCPPDDGACLHGCIVANPKVPEAGALAACIVRACNRAPGGEAGVDWCVRWFGVADAPGCADCWTTKVGDLVDECAQDDVCLGNLACIAERCDAWAPDPACRASCRTAGDGRFLGAIGERLNGRAGECLEACAAGTHWACAEQPWNYELPTSSDPVEVRLKIGTAATVRPCRIGAACGEPVTTDPNGDAVLSIARRGPPSVIDGWFFEVEGEAFIPMLLYPWHSFVGPWSGLVSTVTEAVAIQVATSAGLAPPDPSRAGVNVLLGDCTGWIVRALGVEGATAVATQRGVQLPGVAVPLLPSYFIFSDIEPSLGPVTVRALAPGGAVEQEAVVEVRPGWVTHLVFNVPGDWF